MRLRRPCTPCLTPHPSSLARWVLVATLLLLPGCATSQQGQARALNGDDYPGELRSPKLFGRDLMIQQRVTARWGEAGGFDLDSPTHDEEQRPSGEHGFDAALQIQGDVLTLLGLTPLGSVGFVITLRAAPEGSAEQTQLSYRNETDRELPFPPRFILLDVQRVFWPWFDDVAPVEGMSERQEMLGEERVRETYLNGKLRERSFSRLDGDPAGFIRVLYDWTDARSGVPTRVELINEWFGYRLTIDSLGVTDLATSEQDSP